MANERDNTVPAQGQLSPDARIRGRGNSSPRILFLGNSITLHAPKADIGWTGDWGMAASEPEKDYVHQTVQALQKEFPGLSWRIGQLADWERAFWQDAQILEDFQCLRDWQPEVIFSVILGANTPEETLNDHDFALHYGRMLKFFNPEGRSRVIVTNLFWENPRKDAAILHSAREAGAEWVDVNDLGRRDEMMALGQFAHAGVAMHPSDAGMAELARRLVAAFHRAESVSQK